MTASSKASAVVVDASVILAFYLPAEPYKVQALALLRQLVSGQVRLVVPTLTRYEVLSVLSISSRGLKKGQKLSLTDAQEILSAIQRLNLEEHSVRDLQVRILQIAHQHQTSAYDAAYLALAEQLNVGLYTGDQRFYNALKKHFK